MAFQTKDSEMLAPLNATQSTAYADWTKEVMDNLLPSLLYTYQEKSEDLLHPFANQQLFSAQHATAIFSSVTALSQDFLRYFAPS